MFHVQDYLGHRLMLQPNQLLLESVGVDIPEEEEEEVCVTSQRDEENRKRNLLFEHMQLSFNQEGGSKFYSVDPSNIFKF